MSEIERNYLTANSFEEVAPRHFERSMSKIVDVLFHGKMESRFTVEIFFLGNRTYNVRYSKDNRTVKMKTYSFGWARTVNAIRDTVEYAGFAL